MNQYNQLSFSDMEIAENRKVTRTEKKHRNIDNLLNFEEVIEKFSIIDLPARTSHSSGTVSITS